jgi:L-lactate dehydrogenase complex protein LldF
MPMQTSTFTDRVRAATGQRHLQVALDRATGQLGSRRVAAFSSLEHSDLIRDTARAVKMDVLRDLGRHLARFEERLIANGAHVHWAETAEDANQIIVEIARHRQAKRILKSKSMASEETHLNAALEQAGFHVVETDLGEYIVQLGRDRPSHIIAPIIHLTREDVGELMHRKMHVPYSDDPQTLARYARETLRDEFLQGDVGVTGANFGIVEDGSICLVTNEGNGRMVTTLPPVHVVLMGIEKLVPTLGDLDLFLKILARSATGQTLTAYTTLIRGPRRRDHECGAEEMHVVLLDNGRSRMLAGETAEILGCIRCGACLNVCPIYRSIGGQAYGDTYAGPIGSVLTPGLKGLQDWKDLPSASTLCGACRDVCPVRLEIPRMLLSLRHAAVQEGRAAPQLKRAIKIFARVARHPRVYRVVMRLVRALLRRRATEGWIRRAPGLAVGWTEVRDLKAPVRYSFQDMWRERMHRGRRTP